jgi:hypothetical protein
VNDSFSPDAYVRGDGPVTPCSTGRLVSTVKESSTKSLASKTEEARTVIVVTPPAPVAPATSCSLPWDVIDAANAAGLLLVAVYTSSPERTICGNFTNWSAVRVVVSTAALMALGLAPGTFRSGTVSNGEA